MLLDQKIINDLKFMVYRSSESKFSNNINVIVYNKDEIDNLICTDDRNLNKDVNQKYGFKTNYF